MMYTANYYVEIINDLAFDFPSIAEDLSNALIEQGYCPECGGKIYTEQDEGVEVGKCSKCGEKYE